VVLYGLGKNGARERAYVLGRNLSIRAFAGRGGALFAAGGVYDAAEHPQLAENGDYVEMTAPDSGTGAFVYVVRYVPPG
jgi:hypothetical protein